MRRVRLISIVIGVILLGGLAFEINRAREPHYQGRTLSEWIDSARAKLRYSYNITAYYNFSHFHPEYDPAWRPASNAVHEIGPDAIPFLLRWTRTKDSSFKWKLIVWLNKHTSFHLMPADYYHNLSINGFMMLGQQSRSAWPVLIESTADEDWEQRYLAMRCLVASRPDKATLLPVLLRLTRGRDSRIQSSAAFWIHYRFPADAEADGIITLFPELKDVQTEQFTTNQTPVK